MKSVQNPIEVRVQFAELGYDVIRATVDSPLRFAPVDQRQFVQSIVNVLVGPLMSLHCLYDSSILLCGDSDIPFPSCGSIPADNRSLSIEPRAYELADGSVHNLSFTLEQRSSDLRRDYTISGVRVIRLLGVVTIESDDCNEEEA